MRSSPGFILASLFIPNHHAGSRTDSYSIATAQAVIQGAFPPSTRPNITHVLSLFGGKQEHRDRLQPPEGSTLRCKQIFLGDTPDVDIAEWFPGQYMIPVIERDNQLTTIQKYAGSSTKHSNTQQTMSLSTATPEDHDQCLQLLPT